MALIDRIKSDRAKFVSADFFGEAATYNQAQTVNVIFESAAEIQDPQDAEAIIIAPMILVNAADVPSAAKGDRWDIRGITYYARTVKFDDQPPSSGAGMLQIMLSRNLPGG